MTALEIGTLIGLITAIGSFIGVIGGDILAISKRQVCWWKIICNFRWWRYHHRPRLLGNDLFRF